MAELSWVILTVGHLSMNKFWGETERQRGPLCTSVLIRTAEGLLLIDPSLPPDRMPDLLREQAGVRPADVRHVFLTHFHGDHRFGLEAFPEAQWWMADSERDHWRDQANAEDGQLLDRMRSPGKTLLRALHPLHTPGHTPGLTSLVFNWRGQQVAVAADAVMTEEFFWAREGYHNSTDVEQAVASIDLLYAQADIIIPGHGNAFFTALPPEPGGMWSGGALP